RTAQAVPAGKTLQGQELTQFRAQLDTYTAGMQEVASLLTQSRFGSDKARQVTPDLTGKLAAARLDISSMTPEQLTTLKAAFAFDPQWQSVPQRLKALITPTVQKQLQSITKDANGRDTPVPATCDPGPGTPLGITDIYISKGVALALQAIQEAIPDDTLAVIPHVIATAAYFVAEGA